MKALLKILLLVLFAVVIFMPMDSLGQGLYWTLFLVMFAILYIYYRSSYWVSIRDVESVVEKPLRFSIFSGKVPPISSEDLVRGRLVVTEGEVALYQRSKNSQTKQRVKKVWSVPIEDIRGFSIGKVIGLRSGLILSLEDGDEARFAIFFMRNKKLDLVKALGWEEDHTD